MPRLPPASSTLRMFWPWLFLPLLFFFSTLGSPSLPSTSHTGKATATTATTIVTLELEDAGVRAPEGGWLRPCETPSSSLSSLASPGCLLSLAPPCLSSGSTPSSTPARASTFFSTASLPTGPSEARYLSSYLHSHFRPRENNPGEGSYHRGGEHLHAADTF